MSIAIWLQFRLEDGTIINDEIDKHQILEYMEALDALCSELALPELSSLFDYTDAANNFYNDLDEEDQALLDELNLNHDSDEEAWKNPRDALYTIDTLLCSLTDHPELLDAPEHHMKDLQEEFNQCLHFIQEAMDQGSEQVRFALLT